MPPQNEEEKLLQRRVGDAVKAALATGRPRYLGFLNDREISLATAALNRHTGCSYDFFGGYEGAERRMLCVFEDNACAPEGFPIVPVRISAPGEGLTHRDYLGALLGLGLERVCIGDILADREGALVYLQKTVYPLVADELRSVGRQDATVQKAPSGAMAETEGPGGTAHTASVPSMRLDAVLAAMLHASRGDAAGYIARGQVQVNHLPVDSPHYRVEEGDVFSVRGKGKYRLETTGGKSRKNRQYIQFIQY